MRNNLHRRFTHLTQPKKLINIVLTLAVTPCLVPAISQQLPAPEQTRQRVTNQQPTPSPSPQPTPFAAPATSSKTGPTTKTLAELQGRISQVLARSELAQALIAVKVTSLDSGRVLFEENAVKLLRPASNMKVYTVATALDRLSPDYRFVTSVYSAVRPDAAGVVHGNLTVYGRGDPTLAARFNNGDYFKGIDELANRIVAAGVRRIEGDLIGDETYFVGPQYGSGWEWEDLTWYFGAEVSALTVNDNALDLFVKPGPELGSKALITTGPPDPLLTIINQVTTSPRGTKRDITVYRELGKDVLTVSGSIALDDRGYTGAVAISHPALLFVYLLRSSLAQKGVTIVGKSRTLGTASQTLLTPGTTIVGNASGGMTNQESGHTEIASLQSVPLSVIAAQTLKPSQNLYTELILRTLGKTIPVPGTTANSIRTSEGAGVEVVKAFLRTAGIRPESLVLSDGSGLSRDDMVTADATVQLFTYMSRHPHAEVFRAALPIAGIDGTLRNRLKGTAAESNVRAKTGALSSAASLAGYVTSAAGERLAFAVMVNNYAEDVDPRALCIDPIAVLLASFAAKAE